MQIITDIPDEDIPAWELRVTQFNAGSGQSPVSINEFAQINRDVETSQYVAAKNDADKVALASNERLMALGAAVMAQPDKLDAVEAAVKPILNLP